MTVKPTSSLDVECLLSEVVGGAKKLTSYVDITKEKGRPNCFVKPRRFIPHTAWLLIHKKVKEWSGKWSSKNRWWEVPLEAKT